MRTLLLGFHPGLAQGTRLPALTREGQSLHAAEVMLLLGMGVAAAAASTFLELNLRIPGHAILRAVFPMALGFALVPRRMAGSVMGLAALASAAAFKVGGAGGIGAGAMTSLVLTGPLLDLALWGARRGWRLYLGFALAGLGSNLIAFVIRGWAKLAGAERPTAVPFAEWLAPASASYVFCGLVAGLASALVWFQFMAGRGEEAQPETPQ